MVTLSPTIAVLGSAAWPVAGEEAPKRGTSTLTGSQVSQGPRTVPAARGLTLLSLTCVLGTHTPYPRRVREHTHPGRDALGGRGRRWAVVRWSFPRGQGLPAAKYSLLFFFFHC